jgi:hypothetical protein
MIRDETHRTAVTYHRKRRELRDFTSELTAIPGVGEKRKNRLLRNLGSIRKVAEASVEQLSPFVGRKTAEDIFEHFRRQRALAGLAEEDNPAADAGNLDDITGTATADAADAATAADNAAATAGVGDGSSVDAEGDGDAVPVITSSGEVAGVHHPGDPTVMTDETIADEHIETRLVDPEGDAEDLQPIRSVDHEGEVRRRRKSTRRRGERSTNPHAVKREKLAGDEEV